MKIVSLFCFGYGLRNLDPDVFEMLMRHVTGAHSASAIREFSPFPEFGADSSPVVKSFGSISGQLPTFPSPNSTTVN